MSVHDSLFIGGTTTAFAGFIPVMGRVRVPSFLGVWSSEQSVDVGEPENWFWLPKFNGELQQLDSCPLPAEDSPPNIAGPAEDLHDSGHNKPACPWRDFSQLWIAFMRSKAFTLAFTPGKEEEEEASGPERMWPAGSHATAAGRPSFDSSSGFAITDQLVDCGEAMVDGLDTMLCWDRFAEE